MQEIIYNKECNSELLTIEIENAGIVKGEYFFGVSCVLGQQYTSVYVADNITQQQRDTIDAVVTSHDISSIPYAKTVRKNYLRSAGEALIISQGYTIDIQNSLLSLYSNSVKLHPNRMQYLQTWMDWTTLVDTDIKNKQAQVDASTTIEQINLIDIDSANLISLDPHVTVNNALAIVDSDDLETFMDSHVSVTDGATNKSGPYYLMEILNLRREIFNDTENPLYVADHTPIIGPGGYLQDNSNRISNLENIHSKNGWHQQQVIKSNYIRPVDMLIYKGSIVNFNSTVNLFINENVAQDFARYDILVFEDGLQNPLHPDYTNTQLIVSRIKVLNSNCLVFGIVPATDSISSFNTKISQWNTLQINGIFIDKAGYDFGILRTNFNTMIDAVKTLTYANITFANSTKLSHILGTDNDPSYPNSSFNSELLSSHLTNTDWVLLESYAVDTSAFAQGYESASTWASRGVEMNSLRYLYNVNVAASGIINDNNVNGNYLYKFGFTSALMWSLNAFGTSDTNYGSSSSSAKFWSRPDLSGIGKTYSTNSSVQAGLNNTFHRFSDNVHFILDFTESNQASFINIKWNSNVGGATGIQGVTGLQGIQGEDGLEGIQGETGIQGTTGVGTQGLTGLQGIAGQMSGIITATSQVSVQNTSTETTILQTTVNSSELSSGTFFRFKFQGTHQGQATSGTLTFRMYLGSTAGQTVVMTSQSSARARTYCDFEGLATIRTTGSSGTYISTGVYRYTTSNTAQAHWYQGNATTTTVDTTVNITVRLTAQWATASATNILLVENAVIEKVN